VPMTGSCPCSEYATKALSGRLRTCLPPHVGQQGPQAGGPSPDARLNLRGVIITASLGLVGVIITAFVAWQVGKGDSESPSDSPPRVHISSVEWLGRDGHFKITGRVENLGDNLIWTYNQPYDLQTDKPDSLYPDPGPCPVDRDGIFTCQLGYAGNKNDKGRKFAFWAAVVTDENAYDAAAVKTGQDGRTPYPNPAAVPRVSGAETMVSIEKIHP
jgi:hypothetical protein